MSTELPYPEITPVTEELGHEQAERSEDNQTLCPCGQVALSEALWFGDPHGTWKVPGGVRLLLLLAQSDLCAGELMAVVEELTLQLIDPQGSTVWASFELEEGDYTDPLEHAITITSPVLSMRVECDDYFHGLQEIRRKLAEKGFMPICYGASRNVYPPPMALEMGAGYRALRFRLGEPSDMRTVVQIFRTGADLDLCSVEEQEQFHRAWLQSIARGAEI